MSVQALVGERVSSMEVDGDDLGRYGYGSEPGISIGIGVGKANFSSELLGNVGDRVG